MKVVCTWSHGWFIGTLDLIMVQMGRIRLKKVWPKTCFHGDDGSNSGVGDSVEYGI